MVEKKNILTNICNEYKEHLNKNIIPTFNFKSKNNDLDKYKHLCLIK